jgi:hypothetical protein
MAQEQIKLEAHSDNGTFLVDIMWMPNKIGQLNTFDLHFIDPETRIEIEDVKYGISLYTQDGKLELQRINQTTTQQKFSFGHAGSYILRIDNIEDLGENVTIPLQATPEFSFGKEGLVMTMTTLVSTIIITTMIFSRRKNSNSLFS